jgi:ribosomal protein S4E
MKITRPDKGQLNGSCNRTACQAPFSAFYHNRIMDKYYCKQCAIMIDAFNGENEKFYDMRAGEENEYKFYHSVKYNVEKPNIE